MWLYHVISALEPVWGLFWRFRLTGDVDAIPREGPLIVVANHACFLDPWFLCVKFPRPIHFLMTRRWYYKNAVWEWFFRVQGTLPLEETPDATARAVSDLLDRGEVVGVFPEGRISHNGRMQKFQAGIAHFAAISGAPVLPVGISGAFESLPRNRRFPRPGPVTFRIGRPLTFPGAPLEGPPSRRAVLEFRNRLFHAVSELVGERHYPAESVRRAHSRSLARLDLRESRLNQATE